MYTADSKIKELCKSTVGRDLLLTALRHSGKKEKLLSNPVFERLPVSALQHIPTLTTDRGFVRGMLRLVNDHEENPMGTDGAGAVSAGDGLVIYKLLLRSFRDSDFDGVGDIGGVVASLDYFKELGVDALILTGALESCGQNGGLDVTDYRALKWQSGIEELEAALITGAHDRGIKLFLEIPACCTSQEHPWYGGGKSDYYMYRKEPNNWTDFWGNQAFRQDGRRWSLRLSSPCQPELNWENLRVRQEMAEICAFWLDKGMDGILLSGAGTIAKHEGLPYGNESMGQIWGRCGYEYYGFGSDMLNYLKELKKNVFEPRGAVLLGEAAGLGAGMCDMMRRSGAVDWALTDEHLRCCGQARRAGMKFDMLDLKDCLLKGYKNAVPGPLMFENERIPRLLSRIEPAEKYVDAAAKMLAVLMLTLKGNVILYQGQELGMESVIPTDPEQLVSIGSKAKFNRLRDKIGIRKALEQTAENCPEQNWVPMAWTGEKNGGFCSPEQQPWITLRDDRHRNVEQERADPRSVWNFYRAVLELRNKYKALRTGEISFSHRDIRGALVFNRTGGSETFLICCNLTDQWVDRRGQWPEGRLLLSNCLEPQPEGMIPYEADIWLYDQKL